MRDRLSPDRLWKSASVRPPQTRARCAFGTQHPQDVNSSGNMSGRTFVAASSQCFVTGQLPTLGTADLCISFWAVISSTFAAHKSIFSTGATASSQQGYCVRVLNESTKKLSFQISNGSTLISGQVGPNDIAAYLDTLHFYLINADRDGVATLYIDGAAQATTKDISAGAAWNVVPRTTSTIGRRRVDTTEYFDGTLLCLKVRHALASADEIAREYNYGHPLKSADMTVGDKAAVVLAYDLDEASGANATERVTGGVYEGAQSGSPGSAAYTTIASWRDSLTHHGNIMAQAVGSMEPLLVSKRLKNGYLQAALPATDASGSLFIVATAYEGIIWSVSDADSANDYLAVGFDASRRAYVESNVSGTVHRVTSPIVLTAGTEVALLVTSDGTNWDIHVDGGIEPLLETTADSGEWLAIANMDKMTVLGKESSSAIDGRSASSSLGLVALYSVVHNTSRVRQRAIDKILTVWQADHEYQEGAYTLDTASNPASYAYAQNLWFQGAADLYRATRSAYVRNEAIERFEYLIDHAEANAKELWNGEDDVRGVWPCWNYPDDEATTNGHNNGRDGRCATGMILLAEALGENDPYFDIILDWIEANIADKWFRWKKTYPDDLSSEWISGMTYGYDGQEDMFLLVQYLADHGRATYAYGIDGLRTTKYMVKGANAAALPNETFGWVEVDGAAVNYNSGDARDTSHNSAFARLAYFWGDTDMREALAKTIHTVCWQPTAEAGKIYHWTSWVDGTDAGDDIGNAWWGWPLLVDWSPRWAAIVAGAGMALAYNGITGLWPTGGGMATGGTHSYNKMAMMASAARVIAGHVAYDGTIRI